MTQVRLDSLWEMGQWDPRAWWGQQLRGEGSPHPAWEWGKQRGVGDAEVTLLRPWLSHQWRLGSPGPPPRLTPASRDPRAAVTPGLLAAEHCDALPGAQPVAVRRVGRVVAGSKVDAKVKTWSPGPCVPSCPSGSREVSVCLGVGHPGGLPRAGGEGPWRVWAGGSDGCRDCREQPGLAEEPETPESPRGFTWAVMGQSLGSSASPGPNYPVQERPRHCTPTRGRGEEPRVHRGIQAPGEGSMVECGAGLTSAAPGGSWAPMAGSQRGCSCVPPGGPAAPAAAGPVGPPGLKAGAD